MGSDAVKPTSEDYNKPVSEGQSGVCIERTSEGRSEDHILVERGSEDHVKPTSWVRSEGHIEPTSKRGSEDRSKPIPKGSGIPSERRSKADREARAGERRLEAPTGIDAKPVSDWLHSGADVYA